MFGRNLVLSVLVACALAEGASAQVPVKIDFGRDVLPIFRQNCLGCHGASQQMNGLRLDRRSSVMRVRRVVPGGVENSLLYKRLLGDSEYGPQMPPTGSLRPEQIDIIKIWIEQGANWPASLANELDLRLICLH
jgi:Planctomycete cytochrome C